MLEGFQPLGRSRRIAVVLGQIYAILGTVGFAISGFDGFADPRGDTLIFITVNPLQNLIHLSIGWWLVRRATSSEADSRNAVVLSLGLLGVLGMASLTVLTVAPELNVLNANRAVGYLHLATSIGFGMWLLAPGRQPEDRPLQ